MTILSVSQQKLRATDIRKIVVSDIVEDGEVNARSVRFYGDPVANGAPTLLLEVFATSENVEDLKIATPSSEF